MATDRAMTDPAPPVDGLVDRLEYALASYFSRNRQPCMSGDPRDRLGPLQRRDLSDAVAAALAIVHAHCLARCAEIRSRIGMGDSDKTAAIFEMRALVAWQLAEDFKPKGGV